MRPRVVLFASLIMLLTSLAPEGAETWKRYTVTGHQFSVALPTLPAMAYDPGSESSPWSIMLGAYADGVVYTVSIHENKRNQSLDDFIAEETRSWDTGVANKRVLTVSRLAGKEYVFRDTNGTTTYQFFGTPAGFYRFSVLEPAADDPGAKHFLSSIAFGEKQDGIAVSEGLGRTFQPDTNDPIVTGKEVDQKPRVGMRVSPMYTEDAKRNQVTGTVILKVVFTSAGNVSNIRIVAGLPWGLTERAVNAAKKMKFIPARKDGKYVSMWMQLEYNFALY